MPVLPQDLIRRARLVFRGPSQHTPATRFPPDLGVAYLRLSVAALALGPSLVLANGGGLLVPVPLSKMLDIDTNG